MTTARILEAERRTTQSGRAAAAPWTLEFERTEPQRPDPLTGWNGSGDTKAQVRLGFPTLEAAIEYCGKHGFEFHVVLAAPVSLKIQGLLRQLSLGLQFIRNGGKVPRPS